jgi:hypothetical protein
MKLPELPPMDIAIPNGSDGLPVGYTGEALRRYGETVRAACIKEIEQERPHPPGQHCPWSDEQEARYEAFTDAANAIRATPL